MNIQQVAEELHTEIILHSRQIAYQLHFCVIGLSWYGGLDCLYVKGMSYK